MPYRMEIHQNTETIITNVPSSLLLVCHFIRNTNRRRTGTLGLGEQGAVTFLFAKIPQCPKAFKSGRGDLKGQVLHSLGQGRPEVSSLPLPRGQVLHSLEQGRPEGRSPPLPRAGEARGVKSSTPSGRRDPRGQVPHSLG